MFTSALDAHRAQIERLFERRAVAQLSELRRALGVRSRTTVFFALKAVGYFTSYSHAGRYYTLRRIPQFDDHGLWSAGDVRFSMHGTLRATVVVLVSQAPAGHSHEELEVILGLRVHDTLRSLVHAHALGREQVGPVYVYLHPQPEHAAAQIEQRRHMLPAPKPGMQPVQGAPPVVDAPRIIEVLVAVIHAPRADAHTIAARLRAAGSGVTDELVEVVFARYELGKKTAPSRSPRSRR